MPAILILMIPAPWRRRHPRRAAPRAATSARWRAAISLVEDDDPEGWELVREVYPRTGSAAVVGFTGPPGVGKSTLIAALVRHSARAEREVARALDRPVLAVPRGALLGDRIRLTEHFLDPGVFIRSMATRGALGGLAEAALQAALLMDAAGKDDVYLETVGVGQAEVDVIDHADTVVLVLIPGSGDSIQALKAGVMEIPDVIVVNKTDHPLTDTMVREIRGVLSLAPRRAGACRSSRRRRARGEGVEELARAARRPPRVRRGRGHAGGAPPPQPAQRGARAGDGAAAARAGGVAARGPRRCRGCSTRSSRGGSIPASGGSAACSSARASTTPERRRRAAPEPGPERFRATRRACRAEPWVKAARRDGLGRRRRRGLRRRRCRAPGRRGSRRPRRGCRGRAGRRCRRRPRSGGRRGGDGHRGGRGRRGR